MRDIHIWHYFQIWMNAPNQEPISLRANATSTGTDRTLAILELLGRYREGRTASEIARELGLPHNSVSRITDTMHLRGWLYRREDDRRFTLTNRVADLTRPQINDKSLVLCAWDSLKQLRDATGETAQLTTLSDHKLLILEQCESDQAIKVTGRIGMRVPAYSSAPGKAILAHLPEIERKEFLSAVKLKRFTPTTCSSQKKLFINLAQTRNLGFATDIAEGLEGIHCVAAVILDSYHYPIAALTVIAPAFRLPESRMATVGEQCIAAAASARQQMLK
ncbi:MAG: DNA-binding IclR family transcriptional regulator [Verrucomicrobiales bacterium]